MLTEDVSTPSEASRGPEQGQVGPPGTSAAPLVPVIAHEGGGSPNLTATRSGHSLNYILLTFHNQGSV